jgi:hypothetical protein
MKLGGLKLLKEKISIKKEQVKAKFKISQKLPQKITVSKEVYIIFRSTRIKNKAQLFQVHSIQ